MLTLVPPPGKSESVGARETRKALDHFYDVVRTLESTLLDAANKTTTCPNLGCSGCVQLQKDAEAAHEAAMKAVARLLRADKFDTVHAISKGLEVIQETTKGTGKIGARRALVMARAYRRVLWRELAKGGA